MVMTPNLSDRTAIEAVLVQYCNALDSRNWSELADCFTTNATIVESGAGPIMIHEFLRSLPLATENIKSMMHMIGCPSITFDGDTAVTKTPCLCPMVLVDAQGQEHYVQQYLWYHDELHRTARGWRISHRAEVGYVAPDMPDWAFAE